jgi:hypothetical protein
MNRFLKYWRIKDCERKFRARLVYYAQLRLEASLLLRGVRPRVPSPCGRA